MGDWGMREKEKYKWLSASCQTTLKSGMKNQLIRT